MAIKRYTDPETKATRVGGQSSMYRDPTIQVVDPIVIKRDYARAEALRRVPEVMQRNEAAIEMDPKTFYFYQRKTSGRRCSCFTIEDSPDSFCVCYGTGKVGGFEKWGCESFTLDVTYPDVRTVNVLPNYALNVRPVMFTLAETAVSGYVEFTVRPSVRPGITNQLDAFQIVEQHEKSHYFAPFVRTSTENVFVELTKANLLSRINAPVLIFRFVLQRSNTKEETGTPVFSHFFFRKKLRNDVTILADTPKVQESILLQEYGIQDTMTTRNMFLNGDLLKQITTDDFFIELDGLRWKPLSVERGLLYGTTVSWNLDTRKIQPTERYYRIP